MNKNGRHNTYVKKLSKVFRQAEEKGVAREDIRSIFINTKKKELKKDSKPSKCESVKNDEKNILPKTKEAKDVKIISWIKKKFMYAVMYFLGVFSAVVFFFIYDFVMFTLGERCLISNNEYTTEMSRPLVQCGMCRNLKNVPIESGISAEHFQQKYAYTSVPVLIKDATSEWSAMSSFSFKFLRDLYIGTDGALKTVDEQCQFFPYKTEFKTLSDVFLMPEERANFKEGEKPWYIGWSNCHTEVKKKLRKHYERPYFLPKNSESSSIDWIFMGGSGPGAFIHLDHVQRPSWQAQISGMKTWALIPPPECEAECKTFNVTVHKGDIFVVDTNVWYHSTLIHPGEISITIGSEYD